MAAWLLERMREEGEPFTRSHLFAVDVEQSTFSDNVSSTKFFNLNGFFNTRASHSLGVLMNALGNVVLKHSCPDCRIRAVNYPLPQTTILYYPFGDDFVTVLCLLVGVSFFCTAFAVAIVEERSNGAKHLQLLAGLRLSMYWLANCFWDAVLYFVACLIVVLIWWSGGSLMLKEPIGFRNVLLILFSFGASVIPMTYALTFLLRTPASAMTVLTSIYLVLGMPYPDSHLPGLVPMGRSVSGLTPTLTVAMLAHLSFGQPDLKDTEKQITDVCASLFPQFALARSLMAYYNNIIMQEQCKAMNLCDWLCKCCLFQS